MKNENAVIHGAGGAVADAVAHAFACGCTKVLLTGCHLVPVRNGFAKDILFVGGVAEAQEGDGLDAQADVQI